jgi:hypothetical protein
MSCVGILKIEACYLYLVPSFWVWSTSSFIRFSSTDASLACSSYIINNTINNQVAPESEGIRVASSFSLLESRLQKVVTIAKWNREVDVFKKVGSKKYLYTRGWSLNSDDRLHDFCPVAAGPNETMLMRPPPINKMSGIFSIDHFSVEGAGRDTYNLYSDLTLGSFISLRTPARKASTFNASHPATRVSKPKAIP